MILWAVGAVFTSFIFKRFVSRHTSFPRVYNYLYETLFYGFIMRVFFEGYLEGIICAFLNLKDMRVTPFGEFLASTLALLFTMVFTALPYVVFGAIAKFRHKFPDEKFTTKYGVLYDGLKPDSKLALNYNF